MTNFWNYFVGFSPEVRIRCGVVADEKYIVHNVPIGSTADFDESIRLDSHIACAHHMYTVIKHAPGPEEEEEGVSTGGERTLYFKLLLEVTNKGKLDSSQQNLLYLGNVLTSLSTNRVDAKLLMGTRVNTIFVPVDRLGAAVNSIKCTVNKVQAGCPPGIDI